MKGICVFDLDQTLGDFRVIDYFGYIYEKYNRQIDDDLILFLKELRNTF